MVASVKFVTASIETATSEIPMKNSGLGPYLSCKIPVTGDSAALIAAPGNNRIPACKAVNPRESCKNIGNKIKSAYIRMVTTTLIMVVIENIR